MEIHALKKHEPEVLCAAIKPKQITDDLKGVVDHLTKFFALRDFTPVEYNPKQPFLNSNSVMSPRISFDMSYQQDRIRKGFEGLEIRVDFDPDSLSIDSFCVLKNYLFAADQNVDITELQKEGALKIVSFTPDNMDFFAEKMEQKTIENYRILWISPEQTTIIIRFKGALEVVTTGITPEMGAVVPVFYYKAVGSKSLFHWVENNAYYDRNRTFLNIR